MVNEILVRGTTADTDSRRLVLKLEKRRDRTIHVLACEIAGPNFTNRTLFHGESQIATVLNPELAEAVFDKLAEVGPQHQVLSIPGFLLEMPGLTLSCMHIMVSEERDESQKIMVRFQTFLGSLGKVLRAKVGFDTAVVSNQEKIAIQVLSDIALPLLNLCRLPEMANISEKEGRVEEIRRLLADRADEVAFHVELLKRFRAGSEPQVSDGFDHQERIAHH